jgi:hypothetical protein
MRWLLPALGLVLSGCLTHVGPFTAHYRDLPWASSFAAARAEAQARGKPLLVVLAAGPRDGRC